ncbi:MAG: MFS transporter [Promethearchaeota archaeon]
MNKNSSPRELNGWRLYGYALGNFGLLLAGMLVATYAYVYYVYTININSGYAAIGTSISLLTSAFGSIIFGVIIDNKKPGKLGKRRPFILIGLPIWVITTILIWFPPLPPQAETTVIFLPTIAYFWIMNFIRAITRSLIGIALMSMLPEQSQTLKNREKVATVQTVLQIFSSVLSLGIPMILQSIMGGLTGATYWTSKGQFIKTFIIITSCSLTAIGFTLLLLSFFTIDESFHQRDETFKKESVINAFKQTFIPLRDKECRKYLMMRVFSTIGGRIIGMCIIPFITYCLCNYYFTLEQNNFLFLYYPIVSLSSKLLWLWIWIQVRKKIGDILLTLKILYFVFIIASLMEGLFFWNYSFQLTLVLFYISFGTVLGAMFSSMRFSSPLFNAIIDEGAKKIALENKKKYGNNFDKAVSQISGSYYGLVNFSFSIVAAITTTVVGFIFTGNESNPLVINTVFMSMTFFYFISWLIIYTFKIKVK